MLCQIILHSNGQMSVETFKKLIVPFKQLRYLELSDAVFMRDFALLEVIGTLPSLSKLALVATDPASHPSHAPENYYSKSGGSRYFHALEHLHVIGSFFLIRHILRKVEERIVILGGEDESVCSSVDNMFFGPSMLDVMIQRLTQQAAEFAGTVGSSINDEDLVAQALNASYKAASEATLSKLPRDLKLIERDTSTSNFSAPIRDLVLAVFELNKKKIWMRCQAIVTILHQVLGGTIEQ